MLTKLYIDIAIACLNIYQAGYTSTCSRWKENIIVFYTKDWDSEKFGQKTIKQVHAMVIEIEKGKKLQDKVVCTNTSERFIEPIILSNSANQFGQLLIRHSTYAGKSTIKNGLPLH